MPVPPHGSRQTRKELYRFLAGTLLFLSFWIGMRLLEPQPIGSRDRYVLQTPPPGVVVSKKASRSPASLAPGNYASETGKEAIALQPDTEVVKVGLFVDSLHNLDLEAPMFTGNGYLWMRWSPGLQRKLEELSLSPLELLGFINQAETWEGGLRPIGAAPQLLDNGEYYQLFWYSAKFYIGKLDLRKYPFFSVHLPIAVEVNDDNDNRFPFERMRIVPDQANSGIGRQADLTGFITRGWQMEEYRHVYETNFGVSDNPARASTAYSQLVFQTSYDRSIRASFWSLIQPLLVVMAIVIVAPSLSSSFWDVRIAIPATAVLTLVFMQASYKATIPELPYLTFIDKIYVIAYVVCLACYGLFVWGGNRLEAAEGEEGRRSMVRLINRVDSRFQKITLISVSVASVLAWFIHLA
jgi:hypothetical protein